MSQSWQGLKSGDEETPTCLYDRIQPWHMNRCSISVFIVLPWYLCQRLWNGNRSSYQRRTFCPDTKCLSAGHKCNLSAQRVLNIQINNLTIRCLHVKRRPETYSVWVSHLCWPPWTTCDTERLSLITEKKEQKGDLFCWESCKNVSDFLQSVAVKLCPYVAGLGFLPFKLCFTVTGTQHRRKLLHRFRPGK